MYWLHFNTFYTDCTIYLNLNAINIASTSLQLLYLFLGGTKKIFISTRFMNNTSLGECRWCICIKCLQTDVKITLLTALYLTCPGGRGQKRILNSIHSSTQPCNQLVLHIQNNIFIQPHRLPHGKLPEFFIHNMQKET